MSTFWLIFLSLGVGYFIADFQSKGPISQCVIQKLRRLQKKPIPLKQSGYYGVLTSLLNEQSDEGLDSFVSSMEVNAETLEVHLALGSLLRRRGEYARAVRVHENLLTRPALPTESVHQVQLELAIDYWRSGLLDRAEAILSELARIPGVARPARWQASAYLLEIYQELGQWLDAIDIADALTERKFSREPDLWRRLQAQFSCELADRALKENHFDLVASKARQALSYDPECVRALLLLARHALIDNDSALALRHLFAVVEKTPKYISEVVGLLGDCLADDEPQYRRILTDLIDEHSAVSALITLTEISLNDSSADILAQRWRTLIKSYSREALPEQALLLFVLENTKEKNVILQVKTVAAYLQSKAHYVCLGCKAEYTKLQWQCVSCGTWSTIEPSLQ